MPIFLSEVVLDVRINFQGSEILTRAKVLILRIGFDLGQFKKEPRKGQGYKGL